MHNGGRNEKYTFRFENISFRFTIVEHFVLRIIIALVEPTELAKYVYKLALDLLKDKDGVYDIREYFLK